MFRLSLSLLIVLFVLASVGWGQAQDATFRTWTDSTGKYRVMAKFVAIEGDKVVLKTRDGKTARVPIDRLSREDQRVARDFARRKPSSKPGENQAAMPAVQISATISKEAPFGVIVFGDVERQDPVFVTLRIQGKGVLDAVKYGRFQFDSIKDDRGATLKLLKPLEGKFNTKLEDEIVDLDHFFLDRPDELELHLILQRPTEGARKISIAGSFQLIVGQSITIDNVMADLGKPLAAPGLDKIGTFSASLPRRGEADVAGALAIDFRGDRAKIDDVELLNGDGQKISTGGTGFGSRQQARYIRWTGEKLPQDTKLRIVLKGEPKPLNIPIHLPSVPLSGKPSSAPPVGEPASGGPTPSSRAILGRYVGDWTSQVTSKRAPWTPQEKKFRTINHAHFVLDEQFLRHIELSRDLDKPEQVGKVLFLWGYDSASQKFVGWSFYSNGNIVKNIGSWLPSSKTLRSVAAESPPNVSAVTTEAFPNDETIDGRLVFEDRTGKAMFDMVWTRTRRQADPQFLRSRWAKIETPPQPIPEQVKRLEALIGNWESEFTHQPSVVSPQGGTFKGSMKSEWILDGRFLFGASDTGRMRSNWVIGYDTDKKAYRYVRFSSDGSIQEHVGQWNATSRSFEWETVDGKPGITQNSSLQMIGNDSVLSRVTAFANDGEVHMDLTIRSTRKK